MNQANQTLYVVNLRQLSSDGKKAAANLPDAMLSYISAKQLRTLLDAVEALAPSVSPPIEPELRITAPEGKFVVHLRGGKLGFVSWSSSNKGGEYSAARIHAIITGEKLHEHAREQAGMTEPEGFRSKATTVLLVFAIVLVNSFTFWFVTKPKKTLLPKYTLMASEPAERLLANVAGVYETGTAPGDRHLEIKKDGVAQRYKYAKENVPVEKQEFTVKPAETAGRPALLTSRRTMITIKDPLSVVLFGDTYRRVVR
jgi:hypothetical protein